MDPDPHEPPIEPNHEQNTNFPVDTPFSNFSQLSIQPQLFGQVAGATSIDSNTTSISYAPDVSSHFQIEENHPFPPLQYTDRTTMPPEPELDYYSNRLHDEYTSYSSQPNQDFEDPPHDYDYDDENGDEEESYEDQDYNGEPSNPQQGQGQFVCDVLDCTNPVHYRMCDLRKHQKNHEKPRLCKYCPPNRDGKRVGFAENKDLNRHMWVKHSERAIELGTPKEEMVCQDAECTYKSRRDNVLRHMEAVHGIERPGRRKAGRGKSDNDRKEKREKKSSSKR